MNFKPCYGKFDFDLVNTFKGRDQDGISTATSSLIYTALKSLRKVLSLNFLVEAKPPRTTFPAFFDSTSVDNVGLEVKVVLVYGETSG